MGIRLALRYDIRAPAFGAPAAELYPAAVEQCAIADAAGFDTVFLAEHHGAEDGYCPSPIVLASAIMARTRRMTVHFSAIVAVLHNPLRLAEDLAVLDLVSGGRVEMTLGIGYRLREYEMFGVQKSKRVQVLENVIGVLEQAWSGEPFEYQGMTVQILPTPAQKPRPPIYIGGSSEASAIRAARYGDDFMPATPALYDTYAEERRRLGKPVTGRPRPKGPLFLFVTRDPERSWDVVGPHVMYTTNSNAEWAKERGVGATPYPPIRDVAELKANPQFAVVTPGDCVELIAALDPTAEITIHPLMGGLAPDVGTAGLELFSSEVLPELARRGIWIDPFEKRSHRVTIAIVGIGETDYAWKDPRSPAALAVDAANRALADAGLTGADVDGIVTESYTLHAPADLVAAHIGMRERPFSAHLGIAGAGTVGAPGLARLAIESGEASVVVSYYAINLSARGAGGAYALHAEDRAKAAFEMPFGYYGQAVYFAAAAARYRHLYGLAPEELGAVAVAARAHAQRTPNALRQEPLTMDDFLANPIVADPLRKLDCCLVNDGGVAFVMTSVERARDLRQPPAVVAGVGFASKPVPQSGYFSQSADLLTTAAAASGPRAYHDAGLTAQDVDVAEIYDCFTISMLLQLEDLGFAEKGSGAAFAASGAIAPGGRLPVNTHGGLLSQSYLVGGNHVVEAVRQLRGDRGEAQVEGAEVALVAGLGAPEHATLLLTKDR